MGIRLPSVAYQSTPASCSSCWVPGERSGGDFSVCSASPGPVRSVCRRSLPAFHRSWRGACSRCLRRIATRCCWSRGSSSATTRPRPRSGSRDEASGLFKHNWEPGEAIVITSETANLFRPHSDWGTVSGRKYVVDVQTAAGGPLFRATIDQIYGEPEGAPGQKYRALGDGEGVRVLYDPEREKVKFDDSDPRRYKPRSDGPSAFEVAAGAAPGTPSPDAAPNVAVRGSEAAWPPGMPAIRCTPSSALRRTRRNSSRRRRSSGRWPLRMPGRADVRRAAACGC